MVVGDRLWLFSQPPHGTPAPLQSLLLNNVPPAPQHMNIHPSVLARNYSSATAPMNQQNQGYNLNPAPSSSGFMTKQIRFDYFNKHPFSPYDRPPAESDFRFGNKPILKSSPNQIDETSVGHRSSELANLESRFGNNSSILSDNSTFSDAINVNEDERSSSSSEIDCEEIET